MDLENSICFLLKCRSVAANQRWKTLTSPDMSCLMASKLPGGLAGSWKRELSKIRRYHRRKPHLGDFIMYIEEETMLMTMLIFLGSTFRTQHSERKVSQKE